MPTWVYPGVYREVYYAHLGIPRVYTGCTIPTWVSLGCIQGVLYPPCLPRVYQVYHAHHASLGVCERDPEAQHRREQAALAPYPAVIFNQQ